MLSSFLVIAIFFLNEDDLFLVIEDFFLDVTTFSAAVHIVITVTTAFYLISSMKTISTDISRLNNIPKPFEKSATILLVLRPTTQCGSPLCRRLSVILPAE